MKISRNLLALLSGKWVERGSEFDLGK